MASAARSRISEAVQPSARQMLRRRRRSSGANDLNQLGFALKSTANRPLVIDNFAGGGGASSGIRAAIGRDPDYAINHDRHALRMHEINHPNCIHLREDVWQVNPRDLSRGRPIALVWFSPDCKFHSKARGGKPMEKKIRALVWVMVKWARLKGASKPRTMIMENVEEIADYGPLGPDNRPLPERKGEYFRLLLDHLRHFGFDVEWRLLRGCDYGAPTVRRRLFLIARSDGKAIRWPEPTHGAPDSPEVLAGLRRPWRTAAECIDWSLPTPSIFMRRKALAAKTLDRLAHGVHRFVIAEADPFVVTCNHQGAGFRGFGAGEPAKTLTAARDANGLVVACTSQIGQNGSRSLKSRHPRDPAPTIVTKNEQLLVSAEARALPSLTTYYGAKANGDGACRGQSVAEPARTQTAFNRFGLVDHRAIPVEGDVAFLTKFQQNSRGQDLREPAHTAMAGATRFGLADVDAVPLAGAAGDAGAVGNITRFHGRSVGADARRPGATVESRDTQAVQTSHLVHLKGTCRHGKPVGGPAPAILAQGLHVGEVRVTAAPVDALLEHFPSETHDGIRRVRALLARVDWRQSLGRRRKPREADAFLVDLAVALGHADPAALPHELGLVKVGGVWHQIVDVGMRMLRPAELARIQGFHDGYEITVGADGQPMSQEEQVKKIGNSVCPPVAEALVRANCVSDDDLRLAA